MLPIAIDINTATHHELREECQRLGIDTRSVAATNLKKKLRNYQAVLALFKKNNRLAELLFGDDHDIDITTLDSLVNGIHDKLYERLLQGGYVCELTTTSKQAIQVARSSSEITDTINSQSFIITGRQTPRVVNTKIFHGQDDRVGSVGSCSILFAARMAFADINDVWLRWKAEDEAA